jgi:hypothetical protein
MFFVTVWRRIKHTTFGPFAITPPHAQTAGCAWLDQSRHPKLKWLQNPSKIGAFCPKHYCNYIIKNNVCTEKWQFSVETALCWIRNVEDCSLPGWKTAVLLRRGKYEILLRRPSPGCKDARLGRSCPLHAYKDARPGRSCPLHGYKDSRPGRSRPLPGCKYAKPHIACSMPGWKYTDCFR